MHIAGFIPSGGEVGPGERSFNVGESELTFSANVDPYFFANVTAAIDSRTARSASRRRSSRRLRCPRLRCSRAARFFSGVGYLNEIHAHAWDFVDQPLVYQAFFGGQLARGRHCSCKWLAPTDLFVELGAEAGNGDAVPGTRRNRNGMNTLAARSRTSAATSATPTSWRAGISWLDTDADDRSLRGRRPLSDCPVDERIHRHLATPGSPTPRSSGRRAAIPRTQAAQGAGRVHARAPRTASSPSITPAPNLHRRATATGSRAGTCRASTSSSRAGASALRYDALDCGRRQHRAGRNRDAAAGDAFPLLLAASPERFSLMLDWSPSEFSRLRAVRVGRGARRRRGGSAVAPAIPLQHRRTRRAQVLGARHMNLWIRRHLVALCYVWRSQDTGERGAQGARDDRRLGRARHRAPAAIRSASTRPRAPSRTCTASTRSRASSRARARRIWSSRPAPSSRSAGCRCCCRTRATPSIQPGSPGYFEAAPLVRLLEVPSAVDRSMGDIHPLGNPHVQLDPHNIALVAQALAARLAQLDAQNADYYAQRGADFQTRWSAAIAHWEAEAAPLKGVRRGRHPHATRRYLRNWLGLKRARRHRAQARRAAERRLSRRARHASSPRHRRR